MKIVEEKKQLRLKRIQTEKKNEKIKESLARAMLESPRESKEESPL